jgi:hypothetical protein
MNIEGTVVYQAAEGGFWGVVDGNGKKWRLTNAPTGLQKTGAKVRLQAERATEVVSIFMWGSPVKVLSFELL